VSFLWETLIGLPTWLLIAAIRIYQVTLSPLIGRQCRFTPTCSNYMIQAVLKYGLLVGVLRGTWRILRCNPFCRGGHDPP
jgi:putative membrane protein insertion efficiency factor